MKQAIENLAKNCIKVNAKINELNEEYISLAKALNGLDGKVLLRYNPVVHKAKEERFKQLPDIIDVEKATFKSHVRQLHRLLKPTELFKSIKLTEETETTIFKNEENTEKLVIQTRIVSQDAKREFLSEVFQHSTPPIRIEYIYRLFRNGFEDRTFDRNFYGVHEIID